MRNDSVIWRRFRMRALRAVDSVRVRAIEALGDSETGSPQQGGVGRVARTLRGSSPQRYELAKQKSGWVPDGGIDPTRRRTPRKTCGRWLDRSDCTR